MSAAATYGVAIETGGARAGAAEFNTLLAQMRSNVRRTESDIRASSGGISSAFFGIKGAIAALAGIAVVGTLAKVAKEVVTVGDAFQLLKARLALSSTGENSPDALLSGIAAAADRARVPVNDLTNVYARNADALKKLGYTEEEQIRVTETLAKIGGLSGRSAAEQSAAFLQLSQAISSGKFQGDEFRSVAENMPPILRILEQQLGKTAGELRKLAEEGKLAGHTVAAAIFNASKDIDASFATVPAGAGQAWAQLSSDVQLYTGRAAEAAGVSREWADTFNKLREYLATRDAQEGLRTAAEGVAMLARGLRELIDILKESRVQFEAWTQTIGKTIAESESFKTLTGWLATARDAVASATKDVKEFFGANVDTEKGLLSGLAATAAQAKSTADEIRVLKSLRGTITADDPVAASDPATAKPKQVKLGAGADSGDVVKRMKQALEVQRLQTQLAEARLADDELIVQAIEAQLAVTQKITPEMRAADSVLAGRLEREILLGKELERQKEMQRELRDIGQDTTRTLVDGFKDAAKEGKSFNESLRMTLARLLEMAAELAFIKPMVKSIGDGFGDWLGGTGYKPGKFMGGMLDGIMGGGGDVTTGAWDVSVNPGFAFASGTVLHGPAKFSAPGMRGVGGEAGAEALMPLQRDSKGRLGVVASGGGGGGSPNITFNIAGDATAETVAKLEDFVARRVAQMSPGIVAASVSAVGDRNRRDPRFMRR